MIVGGGEKGILVLVFWRDAQRLEALVSTISDLIPSHSQELKKIDKAAIFGKDLRGSDCRNQRST